MNLSKATLPINKSKIPKLSHEYQILVVSFFIMMIAFGIQNSFGVFFKPIVSEFGWTREATSGPFSLYQIINGLLSIVAGRFCDRFGPRRVVTVAGIFLGLGYLLMSRTSSLWQLYLFYGVLVAIGAGGLFIPPVSMIARLFVKRRGLMTGIAVSGIGVGLAIVPPVASQFIVSYDWRTSAFILGAFSLISIVILAQLLKSEPYNLELPDSREKIATATAMTDKEILFEKAVGTKQLWIFCSAWFFYGFIYQTGIVHIVPYATDLGMSTVAGAIILTTIGILGVLGRPTMGFAGDRYSNKAAIIASFVLFSVAFFGLSFIDRIWMLYLFAVIYGFFSGLGILLSPTVAEFFGLRALGAIMGAILFACALGSALGPVLAGWIFDTNGTYRLAFLLCGLFGIVGGIIMSLLKPI